mgnify:CR=1 FL=1
MTTPSERSQACCWAAHLGKLGGLLERLDRGFVLLLHVQRHTHPKPGTALLVLILQEGGRYTLTRSLLENRNIPKTKRCVF